MKPVSTDDTFRTPKEALADHWDEVAAKFRGTQWENRPVRDAATLVGLDWYRSRGDELLGSFLCLSGEAILALPGFGAAKLKRLCSILIELDGHTAAPATTVSPQLYDPLEALEAWGFPANFPVSLLPLPVRILRYAAKEKLTGLEDLIRTRDTLGSAGLAAQQNLGRRSIRELDAFVMALRNGDRTAAAYWIPISGDHDGPDLVASLRSITSALKESERRMLSPRLTEGLTLEESAERNGVTRERIRQVESAFLADISRRLDYFAEERADLLAQWSTWGDGLMNLAHAVSASDAALLAGGIEALFRDSPHGVAREMARETLLDEVLDRLWHAPDLWFGGTDLQDFVVREVPPEHHAGFIERATSSPLFRLDHRSGRIHPRRPGLLRATLAMIAEEDEPMPLTWLVHLLRETSMFPKLERIDVLRRRSSWRKRFPDIDSRIHWGQ